jgi:hypothetical protein
LLGESLKLRRELDDELGIALLLVNLGHVALALEAWNQALVYFIESIARYQALVDRQGISNCLNGIAAIASVQEMPERAARLLGAAALLCDTVSRPRLVFGGVANDGIVDTVRTHFAAAWAEGQAMSLEQAIAEALSVSAEALPGQG